MTSDLFVLMVVVAFIAAVLTFIFVGFIWASKVSKKDRELDSPTFPRAGPTSYPDYRGVFRRAPPNVSVVPDPRGGYMEYKGGPASLAPVLSIEEARKAQAMLNKEREPL